VIANLIFQFGGAVA